MMMASLEVNALPTNGRWVWKDETKTLEYISIITSSDKKDAKKNRIRSAFLPNDFMNKRDGMQISNRQYGQQVNTYPHGLQRFANTRQKQKEETHVTIDRVKDVAYDILTDTEAISPPFDDLFDMAQFDLFLIHLLKYFQTFFEKRTHENKPNPMNIEPSLRDVQLAEDLERQLEQVKKQLGQAYCVLVLGLGLQSFHHMGCGASRVSATYVDRDMYETIYSFCTFVVWITFWRKDYEIVKTEVGNMLRSDTFNPSLHAKKSTDEVRKMLPEKKEKNIKVDKGTTDEKPKDAEKTVAKVNPADYRRQHPKRPAIKSIIHQRSPTIVAILPSPKDEASWLFRRRGALSPNSLASFSRDKTEAEEKYAIFDILTDTDKKCFRTGIIGEALNQFNKMTLTPVGADNEETGEDEEDSQNTGDRTSATAGKSLADPSRQQTAKSAVTTEAPFSDNEDLDE